MDLLLPAPLPRLRAIQTTRFPFYFEINWRSVDRNVLTLPPLSRPSRVWMCSVSFALHPPSLALPRRPLAPSPVSPVQDLQWRSWNQGRPSGWPPNQPLCPPRKLHSRLLLFISDLKKVLGRDGATIACI